ncbi:pilus assembly protein PilM [Aliivibrio sp. S3MY1]|uniref:type IV pilus biogenesis protein PilM n=1 Tax=unclassified Aliivibrio TaxID=2645654 RepID=UPI0023794694|nr:MULTISPECIES: pilus assembly protein PilM [unclassified Aliivibrio]MDD9195171.1 pilus assembly protein PilM [Aliivibrio sp. S3MY1]MDD9197735.1 pilus assembly protein PilM [Aliivibrio sp. S2MY1]
MNYPTITGLDIGHHSIKVASVRLKRGQLEWMSCHEMPLSAPVFVEGGRLLNESVKLQLSQLKRRVKSNQKRVAFSIPDHHIMSKLIQIDSQLDDKEIEFTLTHAFEKQTSLSSAELNIDFSMIKPLESDDLKIKNYQVFATRKEIVHSRQKCIESAGFLTVLADIHSHSLLALWQRGVAVYPDKNNWILVDIGYQQLIFCITSPNQHLYSKQVTFGASIVQNTNNREQYITQLSEHIRRQITLYSSIHDHKVEGVWITGGGSLYPDLAYLLSDEISLPTLAFNLLSLFQASSKTPPYVETSINQYASALGLGLRGIEWLTK